MEVSPTKELLIEENLCGTELRPGNSLGKDLKFSFFFFICTLTDSCFLLKHEDSFNKPGPGAFAEESAPDGGHKKKKEGYCQEAESCGAIDRGPFCHC